MSASREARQARGPTDVVLERLDVSGLSGDDKELARVFAKSLATAMVALTASTSRGQLDLTPHRMALARSMAYGNLLVASVTPAKLLFCFGLLDWIREFIDSLFDDVGVDVSAGTATTPEGTSTHVGVGVQVNVGTPTPPPPTPEPDWPVPFDAPPEEPRIQLDLRLLYPLDRVTDGLRLPSGLSGDGLSDFTFPRLEPGESGFGFGIRINF